MELIRVNNKDKKYFIRMALCDQEIAYPPFVYTFPFRDLEFFVHYTPNGSNQHIEDWGLPWTVSEATTGLSVIKGSYIKPESRETLMREAIAKLEKNGNYEHVKNIIEANKWQPSTNTNMTN